MPNLRWQELLIIVVLVVLLFGAKRLPDAARGLGRSLRIFKAETKGLHEENASHSPEVGSSGAAQAVESTQGPSELSESPSQDSEKQRNEP